MPNVAARWKFTQLTTCKIYYILLREFVHQIIFFFILAFLPRVQCLHYFIEERDTRLHILICPSWQDVKCLQTCEQEQKDCVRLRFSHLSCVQNSKVTSLCRQLTPYTGDKITLSSDLWDELSNTYTITAPVPGAKGHGS